MRAIELLSGTIAAIDAHALETWPEECCGVVIARDEPDPATGESEWVRRITNVQNRLHETDPAEHPRDARTAYAYDSRERLAVEREADEKNRPIRVFYHSHPEHDAYFSDTDRRMAMFDDEPAYPEAAHVVISVYDRRIRDRRAYTWDADVGEFVEIPLVVR